MRSARLSAVAALYVMLSGTGAAAQVLPSTPFPIGAVDGPIPPLPNSTGVLAEAPIQLPNQLVVHEGRFTWGPDLASIDSANCPNHTTCFSTWATGIFSPHTVSPALVTHLGDALEAAFAQHSRLDAESIEDAFEVFVNFTSFDALPGTVNPSTFARTPFFGYKPLRARWLRSQWGTKQPILFKPEKKYSYQDYFGFDDIRLRGARLYCAAREAHFQQAGGVSSLGEYVGFSVHVLGETIDFFVAEGTLRIDGPQRFHGNGLNEPSAADGAQAFTIPLLFGTRVTPVRGVGLPGFGEIIVPVALTSGDSEVKSLAERRNVFVGWEQVCDFSSFGCDKQPKLANMHSKEYHTVTHLDAVTSASRGVSAGKTFTLMYVGPVRVYLDLGLSFTAGGFSTPSERVVDTATVPAFPTPTREGRLFQNLFTGVRYHDGAWAFIGNKPRGIAGGGPDPFSWVVVPDGATDPFWRSKIHWFLQPHDVRALTDDDHVITSNTRFGLDHVTLNGQLGFDFGSPFEVTLTVGGGLTGFVNYQHRLSDALMAQDPFLPGQATMRPITALTHRPRVEAQVDFTGLSAKLHFSLDLGFFGEIDFDKTLFNVGAQPIAHYDSDDGLDAQDEQFFTRIGTGSKDGSPMEQPTVLSHLPSRAEFATFPVDVAACLADETPNIPVTPPCEAEEPGGEPPRKELCLYGPESNPWPPLPPNICENLGAFVAGIPGTPEQRQCAADFLTFLCQPTSKAQSWSGATVVSRVWNLDPAMNAELLGILEQCAHSYYPPDFGDPTDWAAEFVADLIGVNACHADATLIPGDQIISAINPTTPPKAQPGKCGS